MPANRHNAKAPRAAEKDADCDVPAAVHVEAVQEACTGIDDRSLPPAQQQQQRHRQLIGAGANARPLLYDVVTRHEECWATSAGASSAAATMTIDTAVRRIHEGTPSGTPTPSAADSAEVPLV